MGDGNILYRGCGGGYTGVSICQTHRTVPLKQVYFIYLNNTSIKLIFKEASVQGFWLWAVLQALSLYTSAFPLTVFHSLFSGLCLTLDF